MNEPDLVQAYLADRDFTCPDCRYNLRGINANICPECGLAFRVTIVPIAGTWNDPAIEKQRLAEFLRDRDIACPSCTTNLRGHDSLECPRCHAPLSVWLLQPRGLSARETWRVLVGLFLLMAIVAALTVGVILFL
jgi:predicted amidophosphoribosyltransferase